MTPGLEIPATFELHYPGDVELVPVVRRFVFDLCNKSVPRAPELASRVAQAASELLDNAARHGARRDAVLRFEIVALEPSVLVRVSVANTLTLGQLQTLSAEVEKVRLAADPEAYYRDLQRATGATRVAMGLARIRAEAGLEIQLGVIGSKATVFAQSPELLGTTTSRPPRATLTPPDLIRPSYAIQDLARPPSVTGLDPARPPSHQGLTAARPPSAPMADPLQAAKTDPKK